MIEITGNQKAKSALRNKIILQNLKDVPQEFNKYFTFAGPNLAGKISNFERKFLDFLTSHNEKKSILRNKNFTNLKSIQKLKRKQICRLRYLKKQYLY